MSPPLNPAAPTPNPAPGSTVTLPEITITPPGADTTVASPSGGSDVSAGDPWAGAGFSATPPAPPPGAARAPKPGSETDPWSSAGFSETPPETPAPPARQVGRTEAVVRGVTNAATFGLMPALEGLHAAGDVAMPPEEQAASAGAATEFPGMEPIGVALAKILGSHPDPAVRDAFEKGRQASIESNDLARDQHSLAYMGGQFMGAMMLPIGAAAAPGSIATRMARGAITGGAGGGAYAAGTDIAHEVPLPELAADTAKGTAVGVALGGATGGIFGRRPPKAPVTAGERAATTAEQLNAPLPRGVTSDQPMVQATTAKLQSVPFAGERITQRVKATQHAAGEEVGDISDAMTQGIEDRAGADVIVRPGVQAAVDENKDIIDKGYDAVRGMIDQKAKFTMPQTGEAIERVIAARRAAGWPNPEQGLEQFKNIAISPAEQRRLRTLAQRAYAEAKQKNAQHPGAGVAAKKRGDELMDEANKGAAFGDAHRARVDAREAGNPIAPHPGYNAADYNQITRAMTEDLRRIVAAAAVKAGNDPRKAVAAFDKIEQQFGPLKELNDVLEGLITAKGEASISRLLGATREKNGDARLLTQLKRLMPAANFQQIGGRLLAELGQVKGGEFSLSTFVNDWGKLSPRAKAILFDPGHLRNIEDIVGMGRHIRGSLDRSNTSHTADMLVLYDLLKTGVEGAIAVGAGVVSPGAGVAAAAGFTGANILARYLASPKNSASMAAWARAYRTFVSNPSPARIGVLTMQTRNMANTLGLDPAKTIKALQSSIQGALPGRTEDQGAEQDQ